MAVSKVVTYNPTEVINIDWVVEHFEMLGDVIHSPVIYPIPNCGEKWRLVLKFSSNDKRKDLIRSKAEVFLLKEQSCIEKCYVKLTMHIKNYFSMVNNPLLPVSIGKEECYLLQTYVSDNVSRIFSSPYKDLNINAELIVSGYRVNYSASPRPVFEMEGNCQELSSDLERLYEDHATKDVTFLVKGQKLFAHSAIIRCRSLVLAKMLDQDMLERRTRCVLITDASFQDFDYFLRYLYTAKLKIKTWNTMFSLYSLADKYNVSALKTICSQWLGMNLKADTVSNCLALADLHEDTELKQVSKQFIRDNLNDVLKTSEWKYLVSTQPQLASETLCFATSYEGTRSCILKSP
ncbi:Protein roadkill like protein [Argiope bruennichi]|uniref:Protein roadkill like protein n=1 Tax=Argiope bruennichi TaxID=94029 RepID=A0A8T0EVX7_ARGBR|nr:Protein roadkill like protein [Argiope bruennichi]